MCVPRTKGEPERSCITGWVVGVRPLQSSGQRMGRTQEDREGVRDPQSDRVRKPVTLRTVPGEVRLGSRDRDSNCRFATFEVAKDYLEGDVPRSTWGMSHQLRRKVRGAVRELSVLWKLGGSWGPWVALQRRQRRAKNGAQGNGVWGQEARRRSSQVGRTVI